MKPILHPPQPLAFTPPQCVPPTTTLMAPPAPRALQTALLPKTPPAAVSGAYLWCRASCLRGNHAAIACAVLLLPPLIAIALHACVRACVLIWWPPRPSTHQWSCMDDFPSPLTHPCTLTCMHNPYLNSVSTRKCLAERLKTHAVSTHCLPVRIQHYLN